MDLDHSVKVDGILFKNLKVKLWSIFSKYFLALAKCIIQELITTFDFSVIKIFFYNFFSINSHWIEYLDLQMKNSETFSTFKKSIFKFIGPSSNSSFNCHSPNGIKLITRLRLDLSYFCEHKFRYNHRTKNKVSL